MSTRPAFPARSPRVVNESVPLINSTCPEVPPIVNVVVASGVGSAGCVPSLPSAALMR